MRSRSIPRPEPLSLSRSWEPPRLPRPRPATNEYPRDPGPHFRPDPALRSETTFPPSPRAIRAVTGGHPVGHEATRTPRTGAREAPPTTFAAGYRPGTYPSVTTTNTSLIKPRFPQKKTTSVFTAFVTISNVVGRSPPKPAAQSVPYAERGRRRAAGSGAYRVCRRVDRPRIRRPRAGRASPKRSRAETP